MASFRGQRGSSKSLFTAPGMGTHTQNHAEADLCSGTCVDCLGRPPEVKAERHAVGKHGQRASGLLVASDFWYIAQPLGMNLRATASHIHANLQCKQERSADDPTSALWQCFSCQGKHMPKANPVWYIAEPLHHQSQSCSILHTHGPVTSHCNSWYMQGACRDLRCAKAQARELASQSMALTLQGRTADCDTHVTLVHLVQKHEHSLTAFGAPCCCPAWPCGRFQSLSRPRTRPPGACAAGGPFSARPGGCVLEYRVGQRMVRRQRWPPLVHCI